MNSVYIDSALAATPIYIGPNNASSVVIGNTNSTTTLAGTTTSSVLKTTSIEPVTSGGNLNIGSSTNTGPITIQTSSNLNSDGQPAISIGTTGVIKTIKIGSSAAATPNSVSVAETVFYGNTINNITNGEMFIGNSQTTGTIHIGTGGGVVRSGPINIATTINSTSPINVGGNLTTAYLNGITNIGRNTLGTKAAYLECGSGSGNMVLDFHSSGLFDTDYDARIIASGGTSATAQGNLQLEANVIKITSNLTLPTTYTAPTSGQLGYVLPEVSGTVTAGIGIAIDCCNTGLLSAGTWIIVANFLFPTIASGQIYGWIGIDSATFATRKNTLIIAGGTGIATQGNCVYISSSTSALTFYATAQLATSGGSVTGKISATRIA